MGLDRRIFFDRVRRDLFGGRLTRGQVEGLESVLDGWVKKRPDGQAEEEAADALAYVLATAFHETAATMAPVRETCAASDAEAIRRLDLAFAAGRLASVKAPYWRPDAEGKSWLGRGLVQLTHRRNYEAMSDLTGIDLIADPDRAMDMDVAVTILIEGMRAGIFTGRRLGDYFRRGKADWTGARRIINGTDRAELVARHARTFRAALRHAPVSV
ncbi:MAG: glycoside hydrolase family 19 protein [Sphingobium sp.]